MTQARLVIGSIGGGGCAVVAVADGAGDSATAGVGLTHPLGLAADATAIDQVYAPVVRAVASRFGAAGSNDPHGVDTAVHDALLIYLREPARYDPTRASLVTWLSTIAANCFIDALRRQRRHRAAQERALSELSGRMTSRFEETPRFYGAELGDVLSLARDAEERALLRARLANASLEIQATAAGGGQLQRAEQRKLVKRVMDRIVRRARRRNRKPGVSDPPDQRRI